MRAPVQRPLAAMLKPSTRKAERWQWSAIYALHGAEATVDLLLARLELGLHSGDERAVMTLIRAGQREMELEVADMEAALKESLMRTEYKARQQRRQAAAAWEERKRLMIRRDEQRRAGSRETRARMERCHQKPSAPEPRRLTTAQRMDRAWRRRRYLLTGQ